MVSRRLFGCATEDMDTFRKLSNQYHHILFTDRNNVPRVENIAGTQKLHSIAGDSGSKRPEERLSNDEFHLVVATMPCACLACRERPVEKKAPRSLRTNTSEMKKALGSTDAAPRSANNNAAFQQYEADRKTILDVGIITVNYRMEAFRQRNLPLSGLNTRKG
jgi:hypothetical protein